MLNRIVNVVYSVVLGIILLLIYSQNQIAAQAKVKDTNLALSCPNEYPVKSIQLLKPPIGWQANIMHEFSLKGAGAMNGPVESLGFLKPEFKELTRGYEETYLLDPGEKWLWCGYGHTGTILLSRRLPDEIKECRMSYKQTSVPDDYVIDRITCK